LATHGDFTSIEFKKAKNPNLFDILFRPLFRQSLVGTGSIIDIGNRRWFANKSRNWQIWTVLASQLRLLLGIWWDQESQNIGLW